MNDVDPQRDMRLNILRLHDDPNADTPAARLSLYRFSKGHGGLFCEACHGSPHAEFPSSQRNDNIQSIAHQGHVGALVECSTCHGTQPVTIDGGPHGMHPVGQAWVNRHPDVVGENGDPGQCQACHGADYRGTVLSRVQDDRALQTEALGTKHFWRGFQVGCYSCHSGPCNGDRNPNRPAVVTGTNIALGSLPLTRCTPLDANGDQQITVNEVLIAVNATLNGCPIGPTPTATMTVPPLAALTSTASS